MHIEIELPGSEFQDPSGRILKKKVLVNSNYRGYKEEITALVLTLIHYEVTVDGEQEVTTGFYSRRELPEIVASNRHKVNPITGVRTSIEDEDAIGEFDYFTTLKDSSIRSLQQQLVSEGIPLQYILPEDADQRDHDLAILEIQVYQLYQAGAFQ